MSRKKQDAIATMPTGQVQVMQSAPVSLTSIEKTIQRVEIVRKYISKNLNAGYQRLEKQIQKANRKPTEAETKRLKELEIDYGTIPGVNKKFLLQPGAEKICQWLHVRPVYETSTEQIDGHPGHIDVVSRCRLVTVGDGIEVFSGPLASCTTMESNYRFRWVKMNPQPDYKWATTEGKVAKSMGTHKSYPVYKGGVKTGEWEWSQRCENPNIFDDRNKVRQMSEKRALVKAVRNFGALSEIFTEDPSEWVLESDTEGVQAEEEAPKPGNVVREEKSTEPEPAPIVSITWPSDSADVAVVRLPEGLAGATIATKISEFADWNSGLSAWVCPAADVATIGKLAQELGCTVVERDEGKAAEPAATAAPPPPPPPATPAPTKGKVTLVKKEAGKGKGADYYLLIMGGRSYYCYSKSLHQYVATKALGQECEFVISDGAYPKIIGILRLGDLRFDEDGVPMP